MEEIVEIRWHGRGGQGAKTAALLFGEAALETGKFIQAFPEYGPERMGAPVQAFNRLSDDHIRIHSGVKNPKVVVILDPTLIDKVAVTEGVRPDGVILVNSQDTPGVLKDRLGLKNSTIKVYTVDASKISLETIGRDVPNTPMLGAMIKVTGILDFEPMLKSIQDKLAKKFRSREKLVEGNILSIKRAYEEVKGE
jgi:pyruvate ferredoxin oxidoreductase gamma subunit